MSLPEGDGFLIVFRGSRELAVEFGLVLEAKGIPYEPVEADGQWALTVAARAFESARLELERYGTEREQKREAPTPLLPFAGAGAGAVGYSAVLLSVAYFAGANALGADWFDIGAVGSSLTLRREWWRALTALTLHAGPEHLFGNLLFGIVAGGLCARLLGPGVAWLSILAAGALGNYVELWVAPNGSRAVGASTAVFAALGLLAGYAWRQRLTLRERWLYRWAPLIAGSSLLTLLGAGTEHVDVLGHLLGFVMGVAIGVLHAWAGMPRDRRIATQLLAGTAALGVIGAAWYLALSGAGLRP